MTAPPPILPPEFRETISDQALSLRLKKASGKHGDISHYIIVVLSDEFARTVNPDDLDQNEVCIHLKFFLDILVRLENVCNYDK